MVIEKLKESFKQVCDEIPKNQWRYFHKKSVENFINYIENIKGNSERENTVETLNNLLNDITLNFEPNINYSLYLFNTYLKLVVPTFSNRLGFTSVPSKNVAIFLCLLLISIFFVLRKHFYYEIGYCFILFFYFLSLYNKIKMNKVYGFGY